MTDELFDHGAGFTQQALGGHLSLGRFETLYQDAFSSAIADGVITPEERDQLERTAEALGLDRARMNQLERAMLATFESRHGSRVRELDAEEPTASLALANLTEGQTVPALLRRVRALEARVAELERDLAEARERAAVEVDVTELERPAEAALAAEDVAALRRRLDHDPRDPFTLRALFRAHARAGDVDGAFCAAQALVYLGSANAEERETFAAHRPKTVVQARTSVSNDGFRRLIFHPEQELLVGEIFATIASAVLFGHSAALRASNALPKLDPATRVDPAGSTVQAGRCFGWASQVLGVACPALYADPSVNTGARMVPHVPPAWVLGKLALSGRSPTELAFMAGRALATFREELFLGALVPNSRELEDIFLAALCIGHPGLPLQAGVKARVEPIAKAIAPVLEAPALDKLRQLFLRFTELGGRTNLMKWSAAAEKTAARAGFVLAGDLATADAVLALESNPNREAIMTDLIAFVAGERHGLLRRGLGIAVTAPADA